MAFEILAVVGPTASGKSDLAIEIAKHFRMIGKEVEIVNADAMQLYRHLNIGTAKLTESQRQAVPHHLIDIYEPEVEVTAVQYRDLARKSILEILQRGNLPIVVGGSMFYISAALDELGFAPTDPAVRERLEELQREIGPQAMHEKLRELDPVTADKIPANNLRRVVRALEVIELTGAPYSSSLPEPTFWKPTLMLGIDVPRDELRVRIASRAKRMWQQGLLEEVQGLIDKGIRFGKTAEVAIGYAQARRQLANELTEDQAIEETVNLSNRYARRQMSWFRRDKRIRWIKSGADLMEQAIQIIRLES